MMTQTTSEHRKSQSSTELRASGVGTIGFLISQVPVGLARGKTLQARNARGNNGCRCLELHCVHAPNIVRIQGLRGKCFKIKELGLGKLGRKPGKAADHWAWPAEKH